METQEMKNPEIKLINSVKKDNCSISLGILKANNIGFIMKMFDRYAKILANYNFRPCDISDEIDMILLSAVRSFKRTKKVKFSTWLSHYVRYFCLNKINELKKIQSVETSPEMITLLMDKHYNSGHHTQKSSKEIGDYILNILGELKDKRVRELFKYKYFSGDNKVTFRELAKKMNFTSQTAINKHFYGLRFLKSKIVSEEIFDSI